MLNPARDATDQTLGNSTTLDKMQDNNWSIANLQEHHVHDDFVSIAPFKCRYSDRFVNFGLVHALSTCRTVGFIVLLLVPIAQSAYQPEIKGRELLDLSCDTGHPGVRAWGGGRTIESGDGNATRRCISVP